MLEYPDWASPGPQQKLKFMDWASPKITKFCKCHWPLCQTGPPLKFSLDGGNSHESPLNWILGEAQSGT